jgi:hypothetical protein
MSVSGLDGDDELQIPKGCKNACVPELKAPIAPGGRVTLLLAVEYLVVDVLRPKSENRSAVNLTPSRRQRLDISRDRPATQGYKTTPSPEVG